MSQVCLLCLIGIPACGKTTLSKELKVHLEEDEDSNFKVILVCFDDYNDFNQVQGGWKLKRREIYEEVVKIIDEVKETQCNTSSTIIVLDDNMYYRSMRYEYVKLAKRNNIGFCQIFLESDLNTALNLNKNRPNPVPLNIVRNIHERIEKPDPERYPWELNTINLKCYPNFLDFVAPIRNLIFSAMKNPLKWLEDDSVVNPPQSEIHLADLALRRIVTDRIKHFKLTSCDKAETAKVSLTLSNEKQSILVSLKSGQIILPDHENMDNISSEEKIKNYYNFFSTFLF